MLDATRFDDSLGSMVPIEQLPVAPVQGNWLSIEGAQTQCSVAFQGDGAEQCLQGVYEQTRGHAEILPKLVDRVLRKAEVSPRVLSGLVVSIGPGAFTGLRISVALAQGLAFGWQVPVVGVSSLAALSYKAARPDLITESYCGDCEKSHRQKPSGKNQVAPVLCAFDARMGELYVGGYGFSERAMGDEALKVIEGESTWEKGPLAIGRQHVQSWQAWLPDALLTPESVLHSQRPDRRIDNSMGVEYNEMLTLVGSGAAYLKALGGEWGVCVNVSDAQLAAVDLIRFASEQPHLAHCGPAKSLHPVYLRHAVAQPPARIAKN